MPGVIARGDSTADVGRHVSTGVYLTVLTQLLLGSRLLARLWHYNRATDGYSVIGTYVCLFFFLSLFLYDDSDGGKV